MDSYTVESETEKCPDCGKPIVYEYNIHMDQEYTASLECPCVTERRQKERDEQIRRGREVVREMIRQEAGLSKRAVSQRFRNYRPDEGQKQAFEAVRQFAKGYIEQRNDGTGLLLIGGVGSGKTHLAAALANAIVDYVPISDYDAEIPGFSRLPRSGVYFTGAVPLLERIRASYSNEEDEREILEQCKEAELLILDDLGAEKPSEWTRERLFEIIDARYNECMPTVITTNADIRELRQKLGDRVCDRIRSMCKTYTITSNSHRKTADNTQPEVTADREDFDDPPVLPVEEALPVGQKSIYERMRE